MIKETLKKRDSNYFNLKGIYQNPTAKVIFHIKVFHNETLVVPLK